MIVNPVMYGGRSAEMKTITLKGSLTSGTSYFGYFDTDGNFQNGTFGGSTTVTITVPVGTAIAISSSLSISGLSSGNRVYSSYYLYRVEP